MPEPSILQRGYPIVSITRELPAEMLSRRTAALGAWEQEGLIRAGAASNGERPLRGPQPTERRVSPAQGPESFYLALHRKELDEPFFFTAFMKIHEPGGVEDLGAKSLGTRVVSFRVQNRKLFVFDVRNDRATSDTFDPTLIVEAYPVVEGFEPFKTLPGNENYVLFDPAAGLNRFHPILSDAVEPGEPTWQFQIDLTYMQGFRMTPDGATFEQVFTGSLNDARQTFPREWGTLAVALRRYAEGAGFQPLRVSAGLPGHYFAKEELRERNTGKTFSHLARWNIRPGSKPIEWLISDHWVALAKELPKYDWVGAVKAGVENWNEAFGFQAVTARVAEASDSFAEDDKNVIVFDRDPSVGYAFAQTRINPNTGETRGAMVYFGGTWVRSTIAQFDPPAIPQPPMPGTSGTPGTPAPAPRVQLGWSGLKPDVLCQREISAQSSARVAAADTAGLTPKQRVELFVTHTIAHEVGHALGLRHNFMGSLDPAQSSLMEYVLDEEAHLRTRPGPYDVDAIRFLYGMVPQPPRQRFCNDDDIRRNPVCARYDSTDEPLGKFWIPMYLEGSFGLLRDQEIERLGLEGLTGYLRAGSPTDQMRAWQALSAPFKIGIDAAREEAAFPGFTEKVSLFQDLVLDYLFFEKPEVRGDIKQDPSLEGPALTAFTADLQATIANVDKIRDWSVRRTAVDVLKKMQVQEAYEALLGARNALLAGRATQTTPATGPDASLTEDLLARIEKATRPYFED